MAVTNLGKNGYSDKQTIIAKGALTGQGMHVIVQGKVSVSGGADEGKLDETLSAGAVFCEETLVDRSAAAASTFVAVDQVCAHPTLGWAAFDLPRIPPGPDCSPSPHPHPNRNAQVITVIIDRAALRQLSEQFMNQPDALKMVDKGPKIEFKDLQFRWDMVREKMMRIRDLTSPIWVKVRVGVSSSSRTGKSGTSLSPLFLALERKPKLANLE